MFDKSVLERYKSFILCETDDWEEYLAAIDKEVRRAFILSSDSSRSKLVAMPSKRGLPLRNNLVTLDRAFEILSNSKLLSE